MSYFLYPFYFYHQSHGSLFLVLLFDHHEMTKNSNQADIRQCPKMLDKMVYIWSIATLLSLTYQKASHMFLRSMRFHLQDVQRSALSILLSPFREVFLEKKDRSISIFQVCLKFYYNIILINC